MYCELTRVGDNSKTIVKAQLRPWRELSNGISRYLSDVLQYDSPSDLDDIESPNTILHS